MPQTLQTLSRRTAHSFSVAPLVLLILLNLLITGRVRAQDPFEIHVYEYESLKPGTFSLESHLTYVAVGT